MSEPRSFNYKTLVTWTGNRGSGTTDYAAYGRDYEIAVKGKPPVQGSSDPAFRGDPGRHNPEDMLVAALSACHMLWYLHIASSAGITVVAYEDEAEGVMALDASGGGRFRNVILRPHITIAPGGDTLLARDLNAAAHEKCFIANSVNFPVSCEPRIVRAW